MTLPNFIVIGAPKAGSTSLYEYLRAHPDVFMPARKELDFFVAEHNWPQGLQWYQDWFQDADSAVAIGEASPRYTMYPAFRGVPERIASTVPEAKLIYLVRDPIARMISHVGHHARRGRAEADLGRALLAKPIYLDASRYALQLQQYLEHFPAQQILVVVSEQLRHNRAETIQRVCEFLDLDPDRAPGALAAEHNVTAATPVPQGLASTLVAFRGWNRVAALLPDRAKATGRRLAYGPYRPPALSDDARHDLEARLRDDVALLREYAPPDFDGWGIA